MLNPTKLDVIVAGILSAPNESRSVEFKPSFPWPARKADLQQNPKAQEAILSILALSNIRDGGRVILGVDKNGTGPYRLSGVSAAHLATYDHDAIFEQVRYFGEPEPRFTITHQQTDTGISFIVFSVQPFALSPVICQNKSYLSKLEEAAVYTRTDKPESRKVLDAIEMRDIINLATDQELSIFSERVRKFIPGFSHTAFGAPPASDDQKFNEEIKDLE